MKRTFAAFLALILLIMTVGCAELTEITTTLLTDEITTSEGTTSAQTTTEAEKTEEKTENTTESTETKKPTTEATEATTESTETTAETTESIETTTEAEAETETQTLQIVSYESRVSRNEVVTLTAKGKPNTTYHITVNYKSGPSTAEGLEDKTSNSSGSVSWTWKIGGRTSAGTYSIVVSGGGESETVYFTVETE